ncbi:MAG: hypothetical protein ACKOQ8_05535 [Micrococcales bacterium]
MSLPEIPQLTVLGEGAEALYSVAVVIEGRVYQVISTDGQSAAQFLAQPTFVHVDKNAVAPGDVYDATTGTFSKP